MAAPNVTRNAEDDEAYEGSRAFLVRTPINPAQLDAEITKAMNWRNNAGLIVDGDAAEASATDPVRVWVVRGEVDEDKFVATVKAHKPDPAWAPEVNLDEVKARAAQGQEIAAHEQRALLAHLTS